MPSLGYRNTRLIEIPKTHNQLTDEYQSIKKKSLTWLKIISIKKITVSVLHIGAMCK